mgnify:CR=1 FL=1
MKLSGYILQLMQIPEKILDQAAAELAQLVLQLELILQAGRMGLLDRLKLRKKME